MAYCVVSADERRHLARIDREDAQRAHRAEKREALIAEVAKALKAGGTPVITRRLDARKADWVFPEAPATCDLSDASSTDEYQRLMRAVLTLDAPEVEALRQCIARVHADEIVDDLIDAERGDL